MRQIAVKQAVSISNESLHAMLSDALARIAPDLTYEDDRGKTRSDEDPPKVMKTWVASPV